MKTVSEIRDEMLKAYEGCERYSEFLDLSDRYSNLLNNIKDIFDRMYLIGIKHGYEDFTIKRLCGLYKVVG